MLDNSNALHASIIAFAPAFRLLRGSSVTPAAALLAPASRACRLDLPFAQVELVRICTPEQSDEQHHALVEVRPHGLARMRGLARLDGLTWPHGSYARRLVHTTVRCEGHRVSQLCGAT
eukprot:6211448-Pleurochrysis_carterae.AAC.2